MFPTWNRSKTDLKSIRFGLSTALFDCLIIRAFWLVFSAETVFSLSQQISQNNVSAYFFNKANGAENRPSQVPNRPGGFSQAPEADFSSAHRKPAWLGPKPARPVQSGSEQQEIPVWQLWQTRCRFLFFSPPSPSCLVPSQNAKFFKILRHIESLDAYMKH